MTTCYTKQEAAAFADARARSLVCLSLLCFALADVRDGLGPFLGVYLQSQGWQAHAIGYVMTAGGLASLLCTTPLGAAADATRYKRGFLALCTVVVIAGCGLLFCSAAGWVACTSKVVQNVASAGMAPALAGITLGLVGQAGYTARLGINEAWNHAGNASTAVMGGLVGYFWGMEGVFLVMAVMGGLVLLSLAGIDGKGINYDAARGLCAAAKPTPAGRNATTGKGQGAGFAADADAGADTTRAMTQEAIAKELAAKESLAKESSAKAASEKEAAAKESPAPQPWWMLLRDTSLLVVAVVLFFFHLGNAAMLPLLGQGAVARFDVDPAAYTAATVVLAQGTMIVCALWGARLAQRRGYGWLFVLALLALPLRGCVGGLWHSAWNIIPVQILDGVGAGLLGVGTPGVVARVLEGSGRVNMGLGFVLTIQGIGAALSASYGGLFAHHISYSAAFLALGLAPVLGLLCFAGGCRYLPALGAVLFRRAAAPVPRADGGTSGGTSGDGV